MPDLLPPLLTQREAILCQIAELGDMRRRFKSCPRHQTFSALLKKILSGRVVRDDLASIPGHEETRYLWLPRSRTRT